MRPRSRVACDVTIPTRAGLDRQRHRRDGQVRVGPLEQVGGSTEPRHHRAEALGRGAAVQRVRGVGVQAAELEQDVAERERHLDEPLVRVAVPGEDVDALAHLQRVAGRDPERAGPCR